MDKAASVESRNECLVYQQSWQLDCKLATVKRFDRVLTFRALALRQSEWLQIRSDEGLTLETSALESLYSGHLPLVISSVDKPNTR